MHRVLVAWCNGISANAAVRTGQIYGEAGGSGGGNNTFTMVSRRLPHVTFHETGGGPAAGRLLAVAQLTLAQLAGIDGLGGASAGGHGGEVLSVVGVSDGEGPRAGRPDRRARIAPADRTLGVLRDMVGVRDGRRGAASAVSVTHRGEYLRRIHRRFEAIRRYELDGAGVGSVR